MHAESKPDRRAGTTGVRLVGECVRLAPKPFVVAVGGAAVFAALTVAGSWALGRVVDRLVIPVFRGDDVAGSTVSAVIGTYLLVSLARGLSVIVRRAVAGVWQNAVAAAHRRRVVGRFIDQPLAWLRRRPTGELLAASDSDPEAIVQFLAPLPASIGSVVLMVLAGGWLLRVDLVLGGIAIVVIPLIAVSNTVFMRKADEPAERIQAAVADLSGVVHETVDGIAVVKVLGAQAEARRATSARINALRAAKLRQIRLLVVFDAALNLIPSVLSVVLILTGAYRVRAGAVSVGEVVGVVQLFERLIWPLRMLAWAATGLPRAMVGRERIGAVTDVPLEALRRPDEPCDANNVIELVEVGVVHDDGRVALEHVDLSIRRGSRVAIVGPTGSGKTTLLHVLAGLDDPSSGMTRRAPEGHAVLVFQEPMLFSGSLRENVSLGAAVDSNLSAALANSCADEFIGGLKDGLDTIVGERGVTLSGGQRQRVALARALARRPSVLLLDDTTSALDPATEGEVLRALRDRTVAETVVMVAARPSGIALADEVVLLYAGRIVERGTHDELVARSALYRSIVTAYALEASHG